MCQVGRKTLLNQSILDSTSSYLQCGSTCGINYEATELVKGIKNNNNNGSSAVPVLMEERVGSH